ncbi:MAG: RagB/SusD family nutrient uptake outer membrane protein, partial [Bacteroidales bacterium]|nr:RagB/SusD family nutrient uptake outer membrane protein [Bacteroidales bacterium]
AMKGGADAVACQYLDKLGEKRDPNYHSISLSGDDLKTYIKTERVKEFVGEGFRWFDLKRWGEGMATRPDPQLAALIHTGGSNGPALKLEVSASDHKWVAPIPVDELAANPQIRNQQNPGY